MTTVADIADYLDGFAPTRLAAEWDNVGLILGERTETVEKVITCLTVTPPVVDEAALVGADLIVTHHPMLFRPVQKLTDATPEGRMILALIRNGVAVYSPHTSFDNCAGGINDLLAQELGLSQVRPLRPYEGNHQCKVVVFVPDSDLARVSDAMFAAGAGKIGQYTQCCFRVAGTGAFFGSDAANPSIGERGRREEVSEWRLEAVCPAAAVENVIAAIRRSHSYEEPAFDVYPLRAGHETIGEGRFGTLSPSMSLEEFARIVRERLDCGTVQIVGAAERPVERVALACGAAGEYLRDAARVGADVFLTGEMRFHDYLAAQALNVAVVLPGHYASERPGVVSLAQRLRGQFPGLNATASLAETDPVTWI
jgi:dinuclear metal center YbgI/SA1388 family protein